MNTTHLNQDKHGNKKQRKVQFFQILPKHFHFFFFFFYQLTHFPLLHQEIRYFSECTNLSMAEEKSAGAQREVWLMLCCASNSEIYP